MRLSVLAAACVIAVGGARGPARVRATVDGQTSTAAHAQNAVATSGGGAAARAVIEQYCVTCHNERARTGGLALDTADVMRPSLAPEIWENVVRRVGTRSMPPHPAPRPDEAAYGRLTSWLEGELDRAAAAMPRPGRWPIRRLNRAEYANAIRDLLDLAVDPAALLPPDDAAFGFDNNADLLGVSPALVERYVAAADRMSALAVGAAAAPGSHTYRVRQDRSQDQHLEGLPLGTVGGLAVTHLFPVNGDYQFSLELYRTNLEAIRGLEHPHEIEISLDGRRVFSDVVGGSRDQGGPGAGAVTDRMDAIDRRLQVRIPVAAGPHVVGAAFVRKIGSGTTRLRPFLRSSAGTYDSTGRPHLETLTIAGPFDATGPGDTPSRRRIFTCRPDTDSLRTGRGAEREAACAERILTPLVRRAFRRAPTRDDLDRLLAFYREGRTAGTFESGIQMALRRLLASPELIFRVEGQAPDLASRLAFFLWSSLPDDALIDARGDELQTADGLERQVARMLADPRADALVENFFGQWLHVRNLATVTPNHDEFPDFDDTLRDAFRREIELFAGSIVREDRGVLDLLTADDTFVNERLAKHYGIPHVYGSHFRRVTLAGDARRGLLGKGSLLMVTSHADRTAPVLRGKWILENLMGTPPPPPAANFSLADEDPGAQPRTMRERMERHRASPACAGCHRVMDPLGFALENFDAVGAWRELENMRPVDASGELTDGSTVDGVVALRRALVSRPEVFYRTFAEKLLTYAIGRGLDAGDMPAVRGIVRTAAARGYRFSGFVTGVAVSAPFQARPAPSAGAP